MAGALFGIPLSQWRNADGTPMVGGKLYIYEATTTTPADTFEDYGLTVGLELTHPIITDANGLIPSFWVDDGAYRARLTDSSGSLVLFDIDGIQAIGPSSGEGGGGGGVSATAVHQTGDVIWAPTTGTRTGFVRPNGRTMGSATSGASERANADTQPLYELLWNTYSDAICPVSTGRGANAAADFAANKTITLLDFRGRVLCGVPDMGNTDNGLLDGVTFTVGSKLVAVSKVGTSTHTLTEAQLAVHDHPITDNHTHLLVSNAAAGGTVLTGSNHLAVSNTAGGDADYGLRATATTPTLALSAAKTGTITADDAGSGSAHLNMQPTVVGSYYQKL